MTSKKEKKRIAILGGGPSALFVYKQLIESRTTFEIDIFERKTELGSGMPYSSEGANTEHITNVSDNEIPQLVTSIEDWVKTLPKQELNRFNIDSDSFTKYHVLPRLLFGRYLSAQFGLLLDQAKKAGVVTRLHMGSTVTDIIDLHEENIVHVETEDEGLMEFNAVVICTGHNWQVKHEGKIPGYYDSPYPPAKLKMAVDHPVAVRGASLTAIDAIRTLGRHNGTFEKDDQGKVTFVPTDKNSKFKIVMHSRGGLLPAIRFHLDAPQLTRDSLLTPQEIADNKKKNGGFVSLDFVFNEKFKKGFTRKDPAFYKKIKDMDMEAFVKHVMDMRENRDPFELFRKEYAEAEKSIEERKSVFWKEVLAELSYIMNYPAKYLSAEDMLRLKKVLMPLISVVIAFVPQSSCEELFALNDAGRLDIVPVGEDSKVIPKDSGGIVYKYKDQNGKEQSVKYETFVDCIGQPHLSYQDLPFKSLLARKTVSQAFIRFKSNEAGQEELENGNEDVTQNQNGDYLLKVSGITISDHFQVVNEYGIENERIFIMAVPYIGGYNPDYSGLDFCEEASRCVAEKLS